MNVVTGDKAWMISLNCSEKLVTEYGSPKMPEGLALPKVCKCEKAPCHMFHCCFTAKRLAIQVPVPKGKSINARFL